jgi:hypothetical protein
MFQKQGKFYADWRDASGQRLRKSFTSRSAALQFESGQMWEEARAIASRILAATPGGATLGCRAPHPGR